MTREEEFYLFKKWLVPRLKYNKGAFYQMDLIRGQYDSKGYILTIGITTTPQEVEKYFKHLDNNINKQNK